MHYMGNIHEHTVGELCPVHVQNMADFSYTHWLRSVLIFNIYIDLNWYEGSG